MRTARQVVVVAAAFAFLSSMQCTAEEPRCTINLNGIWDFELYILFVYCCDRNVNDRSITMTNRPDVFIALPDAYYAVKKYPVSVSSRQKSQTCLFNDDIHVLQRDKDDIEYADNKSPQNPN